MVDHGNEAGKDRGPEDEENNGSETASVEPRARSRSRSVESHGANKKPEESGPTSDTNGNCRVC